MLLKIYYKSISALTAYLHFYKHARLETFLNAALKKYMINY